MNDNVCHRKVPMPTPEEWEILRPLLSEITVAINEAISQNERVSDIYEQFKQKGFKVYTFLETTFLIGNQTEIKNLGLEDKESDITLKTTIGFNDEDRKICKEMKISLDDPDPNPPTP